MYSIISSLLGINIYYRMNLALQKKKIRRACANNKNAKGNNRTYMYYALWLISFYNPNLPFSI